MTQPASRRAELSGEPATPRPEGRDAERCSASPCPSRPSCRRGPAPMALAARRSSLVVAGAFVSRYAARCSARGTALEADAKGRGAPTLLRVQVVTPAHGDERSRAVAPGQRQPLEETVVYPRASGYVPQVARRHRRQGDRGRAARRDRHARARPAARPGARPARAGRGGRSSRRRPTPRFSKQNLERYEKLAPAGRRLAAGAREEAGPGRRRRGQRRRSPSANIDAQHANIQRLTPAQVVRPRRRRRSPAPSSRARVERGALVTAGTATPLFKISATDPVRVFVQVPQDVAPSVRAELRRERDGARVLRAAPSTGRSRAPPARSIRRRAR